MTKICVAAIFAQLLLRALHPQIQSPNTLHGRAAQFAGGHFSGRRTPVQFNPLFMRRATRPLAQPLVWRRTPHKVLFVMSQDQPLNYEPRRETLPLLSRKRLVPTIVGFGVGIVIGLLLLFVSGLAATIMWPSFLVVPYPMLSTLLGGRYVGWSIALGLVQFPFYGALIGFVAPSGREVRRRCIRILLLCHITGVVACFVALS